jgi:hypothetical protein
MKDDFILGFTLASLIYAFINFILFADSTAIPLKTIFSSCEENGYFMYESRVIICQSYYIKK